MELLNVVIFMLLYHNFSKGKQVLRVLRLQVGVMKHGIFTMEIMTRYQQPFGGQVKSKVPLQQ